MTEAATLQPLLDIEEIKKLKARYFRLIDTKQFDEMYELFTEDARIEGMGPPGPGAASESFDNAAAFIEGPVMRGSPVRTIHQGHTPEIEFTGPDSAVGVWAMTDYVEWPGERDRARDLPEGHRGLKGYGHYVDSYVKHDGRWKISRMRLDRL